MYLIVAERRFDQKGYVETMPKPQNPQTQAPALLLEALAPNRWTAHTFVKSVGCGLV